MRPTLALNGLMLKLGFVDKVTRESSIKNFTAKIQIKFSWECIC